MGVTPSILYQNGLSLKANTIDAVSGANPIGLNDILSDALSLSQASSQTVTGPVVFNGSLDINLGTVDATVIGGSTPAAGSFTSLTLTGKFSPTMRLVTASGAVTMTSTDCVVVIKKTVAATTAVTLPASPTSGQLVTVKDGSGNSATFNITISPATGTIDGAASVVMKTNYASVDLIYSGVEWSIL